VLDNLSPSSRPHMMERKDVHVRVGRHVKSEPRVSIIMPAFNVATYISSAIESVLSQSFTDYEIIVINDGSPDTVELEKSLLPYIDNLIYVDQKHGGVASARNTGIRLAKAPIIAQLDPDDEWLPNFLKTLLEIMGSDPDIDVLYSNSVIFGETAYNGKETMALSPSSGKVTFDRIVSGECTVLSSLVGKKDAFFRAGFFDEDLRASEDFDMWLRILKSGGRIDYHRGILARYRRRRDSLTADSIKMPNYILQILSKTERTLSLTSKERRIIAESKMKWEAFLNLSEGKKAIVENRVDFAIDRLRTANQYYKKRKLSLLIWFLEVAPRAALNLHVFKARFEYR
jgi:glycosyltransferase involved in cell wall biosynthesis